MNDGKSSMRRKIDAGKVGWTRSRPFRTVAVIVCLALVSASCTNYKARIRTISKPASAAQTLPTPKREVRSVFAEEKIIGSAQVRADIDADGAVTGVEVFEASDEALGPKAKELLTDWGFEPGKRGETAATFDDLEFSLDFYTDDSTTTGEVIGKTLLVIIAIPIVALMALVTGPGGSFRVGR